MPAHAVPKNELSQSLYEVDRTINICTEKILRSSNGTTFFNRDPYDFQEACMDTGAQKSVIGKRKVLASCKQQNVRYARTH